MFIIFHCCFSPDLVDDDFVLHSFPLVVVFCSFLNFIYVCLMKYHLAFLLRSRFV